MSRNPQAGMPALPAVCAVDLRQDVGGCNGAAQGTNRLLPNFSNVINAASGTRWDFSRAVEFDVGREVVGEIDASAIRFALFQRELIGSGIKLAKIIDAGIARRRGAEFDKVWNRDGCEKNDNSQHNESFPN